MTTAGPRFVTIHMIQNHVPANLNRDDLGAPKMAYFGGALRARISSQCLKRSIRRSEFFASVCGGIRTRRLVEIVAGGDKKIETKLRKALKELGIETGAQNKKGARKREEQTQPENSVPVRNDAVGSTESQLAIFLAVESINNLRSQLDAADEKKCKDLVEKELQRLAPAPDIALFGRMLEAENLSNTKIEAACQVAHAISTHECIPEVDYFTAVDDVPGVDAGAAYLDEAAFASACFYKFFSIDWQQLCRNLAKASEPQKLAAKTIKCFLEAAAFAVPTGKKNAYAPFNPPSIILLEIRDFPINYANAFAEPVARDSQNIVGDSIRRLCAFCAESDEKLARPHYRWCLHLGTKCDSDTEQNACPNSCTPVTSLRDLATQLVQALGLSPEEVEKVELPEKERLKSLLSEHAKAKTAEPPSEE